MKVQRTVFDERQEKITYKADEDVIWVQHFNEEKALKFNEAVLKVSRDDPTKPVIIHIDSYGGQCHSLLAMLGTLDSIPNPVITVCVGKAMSCGAFLLAHGDYRFMAPHSVVMIHEVSDGVWGKMLDIKNEAKETERINNQLFEMLAQDCKIKGGLKALRKSFLTNEQRELYLDANAAVKFGIADEIGVPFTRKMSHWEMILEK